MMRITHPLVLFLIAYSLTVQIGTAQTEEVQTIDFRTLGLTRGIQTDLYYQTEDRFEKLSLAYFRPSSGMTATLAEDGRLPFFTKVTTPVKGAHYVLHSYVAIPNKSRQILILAAQNENRVAMNAVNDNLSDSNQDCLFINISRMPLAVQLGEGNSLVEVAPGKSVFHKAQVASGKGAAIRVAAYKENDWELIYSRFWPIYEGQRNMVIFMEIAGEIQVFNFFEAVRDLEK